MEILVLYHQKIFTRTGSY